ncbi:MAG: (2Fe-2S)-binding protein [Methylococcus sp.]|nr:(2Fe-2S)-binding protein [Methylococcus sp.]
MYACICKNVTERQVREAVVQHGVCSLRGLRKHMDACSQCGKCAADVHAVIRDTLAEQAAFAQQPAAA